MSNADGPRGAGAAGWRFVLAGGLNTAVTALALGLLSGVIDPQIAYTIVFACGVALSVFLADRFVFGVRMTTLTMLAYVVMYLAVYVVGLFVVRAIGSTDLPPSASALVVVVTAPLTFLGGRVLTARQHRAQGAAHTLSEEST
jgi:putative flippase GtrA